MRKLYSLAMYLGLPLVLSHLFLRGLRDRAYLRRWGERFGRFRPSGETGGWVVHAASVGEVNAAAPLVRSLLERYPDRGLTITTFTPTGSARAAALFGDEVFHVYAPLDLPGAVRRFFDRVRPRALIVMETEIWPNLFAAAALRNIPILIANARMSERSVRGYRRWPGLVAQALDSVTFTGAQSPADAERYVSCGADPKRVEVTGNLKFDMRVPEGLAGEGRALRERWGLERPVLLAGSTHREDDEVALRAFGSLLDTQPEALLILVPRHPERFPAAAQLARDSGLRTELRSDSEACSPQARCFVIDEMGELMRYYACCDVAFVGGSFARIGGHNVLEPAALGKPVIVGPHTFNFEEITRLMVENGAALQAGSPGEFERQLLELFGDTERRARMGNAGSALAQSGRGALERTLSVLESLPERPR